MGAGGQDASCGLRADEALQRVRRLFRGVRRMAGSTEMLAAFRELTTAKQLERSDLLELLRDYEALDQDEKTINVHVSHLRDKIEDDPARPKHLLTDPGMGYRLTP